MNEKSKQQHRTLHYAE